MFEDAIKGAQNVCEHGGTLCSIGALIGLGVSVFLSGRAAVRAKELKDPKPVDYVKTYAAAGASVAVTAGLIIASDRIHVGKELELAAAYGLVKDQLDKQQSQTQITQVSQNESAPVPQEGAKGTQLAPGFISVYIPYTKQYLTIEEKRLGWSIAYLNHMLQMNQSACLGEWIEFLAGSENRTPEANNYGWDWDNDFQIHTWGNSQMDLPWIDLVEDPVTNERGARVLSFDVDPSLMYGNDKLPFE